MTLRDLFYQINIEGWHKIQCWEDTDNPNVYYEGYDPYPGVLLNKYGNRKVRYIFPHTVNDHEAGITIELEEED